MAALSNVDPSSRMFERTIGSSFRYSPAEWSAQFLERPGALIECLEGEGGAWAAVIERLTTFDQVHAITDPCGLPVLAARAHALGRRLFVYTTIQAQADELKDLGFESTDGFLGTLPPSPVTDWNLQNGDRM
jgi:hypothetical protein